MILELEPRQAVSKGQKVIEVGIGDVRNVIPTTRRAKRILEPRMRSLGVALDRPHFEGLVLEQWSLRNVENAIDGGEALCRLLFGDGGRADEKGAGEAAGDDGERQLKAAVETAIRQLDRQEGQGVDEEAAATWMDCFAGHERVAPMRYAAEGHAWWCGEKVSPVKITEPATGTAREGDVSREAGEPAGGAGKPAAAPEPEAVGVSSLPGESGEQADTAEPARTARAGAASGESGERDGEGEEQAPTAAERVAVQNGALPGGDGEPAAMAEESGKGSGRLPLEPIG